MGVLVDIKISLVWKDQEIGIITAFLEYNRLYITWLYVPENHRQKGIGTSMIFVLLNYARCATFVELDDMSDRYGKQYNIYTKYGFKNVYCGYPEMVARVSTVRRAMKIYLMTIPKVDGVFKIKTRDINKKT